MLLSEKTSFSPEKGHFLFIFECLPLFLLSLFWPSTCSISLSLSLSLSLFLFFSFFLPCLSFFLAFFCFLFFSLSFVFCLLCFCFMKTNNIKRLNCKAFFHQSCVFFWFPVLFSLSNPFFLSLFFSWYSVMFFVQHQCFWFQKTPVEKHQFLVKRGVATKRFFLITCVLQNVKSYRFFLPLFWPNFG